MAKITKKSVSRNSAGAIPASHNKAGKDQEAIVELLRLVNTDNNMHELMRLIAIFLRDLSGCSDVGIRLQQGDGFPYFETTGFEPEFIAAENELCSLDEFGMVARDTQDKPCLECICGNVIRGCFDSSKSFFTDYGSFWTNNMTDLLSSKAEADRRQVPTHNRCKNAGYESVALVPLRSGKKTIGLLQFNDKNKGRFAPAKISLLEKLADILALSIAHKRAEIAMRAQKDKHEIIFNGLSHTQIGIDVVGTDYKIQFQNRFLIERFGDLTGKICYESYQKLKEPCGFCPMAKTKKSNKIRNVELTDSRNRSYELLVAPLTNPDGTVDKVINVIHDIADRKRSARLMSQYNKTLAGKNEELESIIRIASHDLRTPLVTAKGFLAQLTKSCNQIQSILKNSYKSTEISQDLGPIVIDDIPESVGIIEASMDKIDSLLEALLRLAKLGKAAIKHEVLDMNALLKEIKKSLVYQIQEAGAKCQIDSLPNCIGDKIQIGQVFSNLLDNSIKYLEPERSGLIKVSGCVKNDKAVYCVEDNGIGIDCDNPEYVFDVFYRLNPGRSKGEGMGLSIIRRILDKHNGKVWVHSEPNVGSKFFVSLPLAWST
ncbi:MAG: ATP-binding protein [Planctomycetota bacterium]|jgi:signal transduction histidine kinase